MATNQSGNASEKTNLSREVANAVSESYVSKATKFVGGIVVQAVTSDTFFDWLAHGSTELANMVLHGHAAPVYSRSGSPDASMYVPATESVQPSAVSAPEMNEIEAGTANIIDKHLPTLERTQLQAEQAVLTSHGAPQSSTVGIVEQHMQDLKAMPKPQLQDQEVSR